MKDRPESRLKRRAVSIRRNQRDSLWSNMLWPMVSKAAEMSTRRRKETLLVRDTGNKFSIEGSLKGFHRVSLVKTRQMWLK